MKTRIIFVRYGETLHNVKKLVQGHIPGKLSKLGMLQAKKVGERLKDEKIDIIFVSDLNRTKKTAQEIIRYHKDTPVMYDERIRERNYARYEGKPSIHLRIATSKSKKEYIYFRPKGGESEFDVTLRSKKFFTEILNKYRRKNILIVSYGGFIRITLMHMLNESNDNYKKYIQSNTGISIIEINDKKIRLKKLNCTKHLK